MVSNKPLPNFIAFGNCLVDQSVKVNSHDILKRYKLNPNELGECSQEILNNILQDISHENLKVNVHLGGSALNTCRILNGISDARILFCGAIGDDDNGRFIEQELKGLGIDTFLQTIPTESTGTCICLIHNEDRCCLANIGASKNFTTDNLNDKLDDVLHLKEKVVFYIEGFFLTERSNVCRYIVQRFSKPNSNIAFAVNLSASYIIENHTDDLNYLIAQAEIVFGNKDEFEVLAKCSQRNSVIEYMYSVSESMQGHKKIIVITDGNQPIEIYTLTLNEPFKWETLDVRVISKQDVNDTTGAGDAFVAGFFHTFFQQDVIRNCVHFGMEVALKKLKNIGAHL